MKFQIKKGQHVYFSQRGHKGFFYPCKKRTEVLYDVSADRVPWVGSNTRKPVSVPEDAIIEFGSNAKKTVVWI